MNISQLLQLQKKKADLQKKKKKMLNKALQKKKKEQINFDQIGVKKGYIQKTKIIQKKKYQIIHEKARTHIPIEIQDNASVSSYLINNSSFQKVYQRTKKIINLSDNDVFDNSICGLKSFAEEKYEKIFHLKLIFQKNIDCRSVIRPFQLNLPFKNTFQVSKKTPIPKSIILVKDAKSIQKNPNYKNLIDGSIAIKQYREFVNDFKRDKQFKKKVSNNRILILCDWQIYKESNKFIQNLLDKGHIVFPFDAKKVPYFVEQKYPGISYEKYVKLMIQNEYALIKSGKQHTVHIKLIKNQQLNLLCQNIKQTIIQTVSKLIERNKDKSGNQLVQAEIKSNTSINFVIYKK